MSFDSNTGSQTNGFVETIRQTPASLIEAIVCFLSLWSLLGLVGYHTYLVSVNMTTNEDVRIFLCSCTLSSTFRLFLVDQVTFLL